MDGLYRDATALTADLAGDLRRLSTAFHEAGHVVIAAAHGFAVCGVTIAREREYLGITRFDDGLTARIESALAEEMGLPPDLRDAADRFIVVTLAGPIAQERHTGETNVVGASRDLDIVTALIMEMTEDAEEAADCYDRLRAQAEQEVTQHWETIEQVAAALHEETTLGEARLQSLLAPGG